MTIAFCVCGTIAALTYLFWAKVLLGLQGSVYASIVIFKLFQSLSREQNRTSTSHRVRTFNITATTLIWPLYVATWGMGPDVYHVISGRREWIIQSIFSIVLKTISASFAILTYSEVDIENAASATMELVQCFVYG
jgi:bacteriorhodopsin